MVIRSSELWLVRKHLRFTTMNYTAEFSKVRDELKKGDNKKDWRAAFNALDYTFLGQKVGWKIHILLSILLSLSLVSRALGSSLPLRERLGMNTQVSRVIHGWCLYVRTSLLSAVFT